MKNPSTTAACGFPVTHGSSAVKVGSPSSVKMSSDENQKENGVLRGIFVHVGEHARRQCRGVRGLGDTIAGSDERKQQAVRESTHGVLLRGEATCRSAHHASGYKQVLADSGPVIRAQIFGTAMHEKDEIVI